MDLPLPIPDQSQERPQLGLPLGACTKQNSIMAFHNISKLNIIESEILCRLKKQISENQDLRRFVMLTIIGYEEKSLIYIKKILL